MEGMKTFPDNYFDLAIVDPPYGIKGQLFKQTNFTKDWHNKLVIHKNKKRSKWNTIQPNIEYFIELERISKNRIIWGGNHFANYLNSSPCWLVWDKVNGASNQADCELAYTSFTTTTRKISYMWSGLTQGKSLKDGHIMEGNNRLWEKRMHPTQKPTKLYKWILHNYADPNFKIIDTHAGSCSSVIAFLDFGCNWIAFEIDKDYYKAASKRIENHKLQLKLF